MLSKHQKKNILVFFVNFNILGLEYSKIEFSDLKKKWFTCLCGTEGETSKTSLAIFTTLILGRYAALILGPAAGWLTLLIFVYPLLFLFYLPIYKHNHP